MWATKLLSQFAIIKEDVLFKQAIIHTSMPIPVGRVDRRWASEREDTIVRKGCARAHVQMRPISDLYKTHRMGL